MLYVQHGKLFDLFLLLCCRIVVAVQPSMMPVHTSVTYLQLLCWQLEPILLFVQMMVQVLFIKQLFMEV